MTSKALLIGINYQGTDSALNGCINDVKNMKAFLMNNGYHLDDINIMTDKTAIKPTRINMITEILHLLLSGADKLFLHYSGHGSWAYDSNDDESDNRDENIVPLDYQNSGMITDDQLRGLLAFLPSKSKLTVILDCCHSGTGMDLAYDLQTVKKWQGRKRCQTLTMKRNPKLLHTPSTVVMLSGCMDAQTSADAYEENKYQGAMTYCLLKALESRKDYTWEELMLEIRRLLEEHKYVQIDVH